MPGEATAEVTTFPGLLRHNLVNHTAKARERLSAFKLPTCWVVAASADAVPMTATSKVDKAALQALLQREGRRG